MRFLMDAHQLGMRQTGNETWCRNVLRHLEAELAGHELHVAVTEHGLRTLQQLTGAPHHIVSANAVRRLVVDLPAVVGRARVDAMLAQYTILPGRVPAVVMIHDLSPLDRQSRQWLSLRFRLRFRASVELSVRTAATVLAPSQFTRQDIVDTFSLAPDRVVVAPNAVDPELAALLDGGTRSAPPVTTVLSVGNVLPRKNLVTVASAVRRLQLRGLRINYRVVGKVGRHGVATARELQRVLPNIEITDYVSSRELAQHYLACSLLAFPSMFEGFGIPMVEAMRASLPVICSASTSLPEIAAGACTLVPPLDVDAWAAAIELLSTDDAAWQRLSRLGRMRTLQFDWRDTARVVADSLLTAAVARHSLPEAA